MNVGDKVRVVSRESTFNDKVGTILSICDNPLFPVEVGFDDEEPVVFGFEELASE